ncbi:MAG: hypothetical protein JST54_33940 [Deltaproteobacteria bacterium]|nr:hypothetical protein [Deltaproteobacteria bacterium]
MLREGGPMATSRRTLAVAAAALGVVLIVIGVAILSGDDAPPRDLAAGAANAPERAVTDLTAQQPKRPCHDGPCPGAPPFQPRDSWLPNATSDSPLADGWIAGEHFEKGDSVAAVAHKTGGSWRVENLPEGGGDSAFTIFGSSANDLWVGGRHGHVWHFNGRSWRQVQAPTDCDVILGVAASPTSAWAIAEDNGKLLYWNGTDWVPSGSITSGARDLWLAPDRSVWVVGDHGLLRRFQDGRWTKLDRPNDPSFMKVWGSGLDDIWISGFRADHRALYHWDGATWTYSISSARRPNVLSFPGYSTAL